MNYRRKIPAGVYGILDTVTDEIVYIGESEFPIARRNYHFQKPKPHMDSIIRRYMRERGFDNFHFFMIKEEGNHIKRAKLEKTLMHRLKPIGNIRKY